MSDTPETNAEELVQMGQDWTFVNADFARKLERERDEAREVLVEIRDWIDVASTRPKCTFSMDEVAETINSWGDKIRTTLKETSK